MIVLDEIAVLSREADGAKRRVWTDYSGAKKGQ